MPLRGAVDDDGDDAKGEETGEEATLTGGRRLVVWGVGKR
jgi:hypothetical protein